MELKELLGNDYKDGMTVEEISTALKNKKFVEKSIFDATASDLAKYKRDFESADNTLKETLDKINTQSREFAIKSNKLDIEQLFVAEGIKKEEYNSFIGAIVTDDLDKSAATANEIIRIIKLKMEAAKAEQTKALFAQSPKPDSTPPSDITKAQFDKMTATEQMKLAIDHPNIYKNLK